MNRHFVILVVLTLCGISVLPPNSVFATKPNNENDIVTLFSDRNLYIVGESIQFAAYVSNKSELSSSVLYAEIINQDNKQIAFGKFKIVNSKVSGILDIPSDIASGNYFIKAYTRWMRNFSPLNYSVTSIKIINPLKHTPEATVVAGNENNINFFEFKDSSQQIAITPNQSEYKTRQNGTLKIDFGKFSPSINWLCLTIAPSATLNGLFSNKDNEQPISINPYYYKAETEGLTFSAKVENAESHKPSPFALVNISILGSYADFLAGRTDSSGFFSIQLPEITGSFELYVGVTEDAKSIVKVDNDFCTRSIGFNIAPFKLSEEETFAAENFIQNIEVHNYFYNPANDLSLTDTFLIPKRSAFYGTPTNVFNFDDYVDLLSVREYLYEFLPVSVKGINGKLTFSINSNSPELNIYEPLVLIDNIAICNASRILTAKPDLLSHIEIISTPYYKGNMIYGGILSFYSKNNDFAGIELSPSDIFIKYNFFTEHFKSEQPVKIDEKMPDTRNTLLWISNIDFSQENSTEIKFRTSDTKGLYDILLRGIKENGEPILIRKSITVY